jgi:hypothetical protein
MLSCFWLLLLLLLLLLLHLRPCGGVVEERLIAMRIGACHAVELAENLLVVPSNSRSCITMG